LASVAHSRILFLPLSLL